MTISLLQCRVEIGNFSNFSAKHLTIKANEAIAPIHFRVKYLNCLLTSFIFPFFYCALMMVIVKLMFLCKVTVYLFFVEILQVILNTFINIRIYSSYILSIFVVYFLYNIRLIRLSGDIEVNPGPKPTSFKNFSICHWNLNSIASHNFLKVKLL